VHHTASTITSSNHGDVWYASHCPLMCPQLEKIKANPDWIKSAQSAAAEWARCLESLRERVQAERALREIRPIDSLRAAIWGIG